MIYRIEYVNRYCDFANSRADLLNKFKLSKNETITDVRKIYKNGASDSVFDMYRELIRRSRL